MQTCKRANVCKSLFFDPSLSIYSGTKEPCVTGVSLLHAIVNYSWPTSCRNSVTPPTLCPPPTHLPSCPPAYPRSSSPPTAPLRLPVPRLSQGCHAKAVTPRLSRHGCRCRLSPLRATPKLSCHDQATYQMIVKSLASCRCHPIRRIQIVDHDAAGGHAIHVHAKRGFEGAREEMNG